MSQPFGPKSLAVLNHLAQHGHKNRLEMEIGIGVSQLATHINKLQAGLYIRALPKKRGELVSYQITNKGLGAVGAHIQRQESLRYRPMHELPAYVPSTEFTARAGAMDAFKLPSRGIT